MLKKLALLIALMYSVAGAQQTATLDPGQVYNTGNIVNWEPSTNNNGVTPWINSVYQQSLTCWGPGGPGNCGPYPTVRPDAGTINFSYGMTDVHQIANIASVLSKSGTGLNINGYNFAFYAKNGNGWDNGQQDYLTAYVKFYDTNGGTVVNNQYNLNYRFNWTYFNLNKTFDTPYASKDLSTVQYGFVGMDSNFWAGTYGPEIYNISFNLKYSVDPCGKDPLYSPTCPGYMDALNKLLPPATVVSDPVVTVATTATLVTEPSVVTTTTATASSAVSIGQPSVVASVVSAPAPTTSSSSSSSTSTSSSSQSKESTSSSGSTSLALSIISKNSDRDAAGSAVAQAAVSQAQAAATQAQQEAASVAASAVANSTTVNAVTVGTQQSSGNGIRVNNSSSNSTNFSLPSGQTSIASLVSGPQIVNNTTAIVQQQNSSGLGINVSNNQPVVVSNIITQQFTTSESVITYALPLLQPQQYSTSVVATNVFDTIEQTQSQQTTQSSGVLSQSSETYSIVPPNFLTDKSNPLTDIIENKQNIPQNSTIATIGSSVNRSVGDNEVAGGVDLNKMALAPVGYNDYLNLVLRDASFYAPKEVYKNQKNVDNARALRQLSSDRLHQDMVEQQYRR